MSDREKLISRISQLADDAIGKLLQLVITMFGAGETEGVLKCPYCGAEHIIRYGHKCGKQRFFCKICEKTFVTTTHTVMSHSHFSKDIWGEVITDTLRGYSINFTAQRLGIYHQAVFDMRHKVLMALQQMPEIHDVQLGGVVELDETFVLDSYKGKPLDVKTGRKPRHHGARAKKPGISNEYVCINTGVERKGGNAYAATVNRAKPDTQEIKSVFEGHVADEALVLCDGLKSYRGLSCVAHCTVCNCNSKSDEEKGFFNLNTVNSFHSFLKHRYAFYRGVATKYLNRYNALFAAVFRHTESLIVHLKDSLLSPTCSDRYHTNRDVRTLGLLTL